MDDGRTADRDRAVVVVLRGPRVLVVTRERDGRAYSVLPGGGVEAGESARDAAVRELAEETGLRARVGEPLWVRHDGGRRATYYRARSDAGEVTVGGPERDRSSTANRYGLRWVSSGQLDDIGLQPAALVPLLRGLLDGHAGHDV